MRMVFVFGSNKAGRHGKGAALMAKTRYGAIYGQGVGPQGDSYAIPTKDEQLQPMPLVAIEHHVVNFLKYARDNPTRRFKLTAIGCGLAGYKPSEIAPLFAEAPHNVYFPPEFKGWIEHSTWWEY